MKVMTMTSLARSVSLALAGTLALTALPASAVLQDNGPADPVLYWPQWYRDLNGTAVGLCKSQAVSPNAAAGGATMCFPPAFDPAGFPGNVGEEIFYNMMEIRQKQPLTTTSGFNFLYLTALEASYLPGPIPRHGDEAVFTRIRIAINFNDPSKNGHYKVTHPFGVHEFNLEATDTQTLQGANAAVFFTVDVPGTANDFAGALKGTLGPFIQWDQLNPGETLTVGNEQFLGDPNYAHTFTGSPFVDAQGNPQNYVRVDGPPGSNLDGAGNDFLVFTEAFVLGQKWTAPIATPTAVTAATLARTSTGANSIDVWAQSATGNKLILTGDGMPSMEMIEDGVFKGHYHGHVEFTGQSPSGVTVTNATSNPVLSVPAGLVDKVEITQAKYDTATRLLSVIANTSDQLAKPALFVENIPGVSGVTAKLGACTDPAVTAATPTDQCFVYPLPANVEPPTEVFVRSAALGGHGDTLEMVTGFSQDIKPAPAAGTLSFSVNTNGATPLTALPANAIIIAQPASGSVTPDANGQYQFLANPGAAVGNDSFSYVIQDTNSGAVSAVAIGHLALQFIAAPPTANLDQYAARVSTGTTATTNFPRVLSVLGNDKAATATDPLNAMNPASVAIVTPPTRGTATANANGTITYRATSAGADSFTYRVANANGDFSAPATVLLTNFGAAETVGITRARYLTGTWDIAGTTTWFGPNLTQTGLSCWVTQVNRVNVTPIRLVNAAPVAVDATGGWRIQGSGLVLPTGTTQALMTCTTSNGGSRAGFAVTFR